METQNKTWLWVAGVVAVAAVLGGWFWWSNQAVAPTTSETAGPALGAEDTTAAIDQELNATDLGDLEAELQATEADLQAL